MAFMQMLPDVGMNYTFNRPLLDGTSPARLKEIGAIAPRIKDYNSWQFGLRSPKKPKPKSGGWTPHPTITALSSICPPVTFAMDSTTTSPAIGLSE
jgi:hypothetical protein